MRIRWRLWPLLLLTEAGFALAADNTAAGSTGLNSTTCIRKGVRVTPPSAKLSPSLFMPPAEGCPEVTSAQPSKEPPGPATPIEKGEGGADDLSYAATAPPIKPRGQKAQLLDSGVGKGGFADTNSNNSALTQPSYGSLLSSSLPPAPDLPQAVLKAEKADIEPAEVVVIHTDPEQARQFTVSLKAMGFSIKRRRNLKSLGLILSVIRLPVGSRVGDALQQLRGQLPDLWADANHRYTLLADTDPKSYSRHMTGWHSGSGDCGAAPKIGMIDTGVTREHPAFRGASMTQKLFLPAGVETASPKHGTAIAALLVGQRVANAVPAGLLPDAQVYVAAIFRKRGGGLEDTTAEQIVYALDWLLEQKVTTINLSLGGPRNLLLEAALQRVLQAGIAVAAAAGNGGPRGKPIYPAAQKGVVAVTAVDAGAQLYRQATRASYVAFSAPGVDVWSATPAGQGAYFSGTSYAVPFVTAALAIRPRQMPASAMIDELSKSAIDLGKPGRDADFGWGLIQTDGQCEAPL